MYMYNVHVCMYAVVSWSNICIRCTCAVFAMFRMMETQQPCTSLPTCKLVCVIHVLVSRLSMEGWCLSNFWQYHPYMYILLIHIHVHVHYNSAYMYIIVVHLQQ